MNLKTEIQALEYGANQAARHPLVKVVALPKILTRLFRILREIAARIEPDETPPEV